MNVVLTHQRDWPMCVQTCAQALLVAAPTTVDESDKDGNRAVHVAIRCQRGRDFLLLLTDHKAVSGNNSLVLDSPMCDC